ncbi:MAG: hypothetical protein ACK55I_43455, partial [bacterium]
APVIRRKMRGDGGAQRRNAEDVGVEADARFMRQPCDLVIQSFGALPARHRLAEVEQLPVPQPRPDPALRLHDRRRLDPVDGGIDGIGHDGAPTSDRETADAPEHAGGRKEVQA